MPPITLRNGCPSFGEALVKASEVASEQASLPDLGLEFGTHSFIQGIVLLERQVLVAVRLPDGFHIYVVQAQCQSTPLTASTMHSNGATTTCSCTDSKIVRRTIAEDT